MNKSGELWQQWFERVGNRATADVVNATAKLVIAEREIGVRFYTERMDALQRYQKDLPEPYRTELCNILANGRPKLHD